MTENKHIDLPVDFVERVKNDPFLGTDLLKALDTSPPNSLRLNPKKGKHLFAGEKNIPWSENGKWLEKRPVYTLDPHFHAGAYYPQEAGSQLLNYTLRQLDLPENPIVLDLCAAPGGKSTLILDFLDGNGLLVSNEIIPNRAKILHENITKWGAVNSVICNNSSEAFLKLSNFFDCMVIDAPCSGEGMFRKDLESRNEWSLRNVDMCAERQREIIDNCWDSLKTNGYLVYSTCTFNSTENEENIAWICDEFDAEIVNIHFPPEFKSRNGIGVYALPNLVDTEGFYICVLRKRSVSSSKKHLKTKPFAAIAPNRELEQLVRADDEVKLIHWKERAWLIPSALESEIAELTQALNVFKIGICIGEPTRKGWIPDESLAFVKQYVSDAVPVLTLDKQQALHYLKGETFSLEAGQGYALVEFEGSVLGWIKRIDRRFNNCYPKEWRIRMRVD